MVYVISRKNGQDRGGDGSNKRRHEGSGEEPYRHGEMLWYLCGALQQVSSNLYFTVTKLLARNQINTCIRGVLVSRRKLYKRSIKNIKKK